MNSIDFCYWLQGYFEINGEVAEITQEQAQIIQNHLHLVFKHEIDDMYKGDKVELQNIHDGKVKLKPSNTNFDPLGNDVLLRC